jgi:hypothetical protein
MFTVLTGSEFGAATAAHDVWLSAGRSSGNVKAGHYGPGGCGSLAGMGGLGMLTVLRGSESGAVAATVTFDSSTGATEMRDGVMESPATKPVESEALTLMSVGLMLMPTDTSAPALAVSDISCAQDRQATSGQSRQTKQLSNTGGRLLRGGVPSQRLKEKMYVEKRTEILALKVAFLPLRAPKP